MDISQIVLDPSQFQDTLKLASAHLGSKYFQDYVRKEYPGISLSDEDGMYDMQYLYQEIQATTGEEISETYKAVLTEFSFEKQEEYLQRLDAAGWEYIIKDQSRYGCSAQLLDKSTEAFHRHASCEIQNKVLSYFLYWNSHRNSTIGSYVNELSKTPTGRETLKAVGQNFIGKNWMEIIPQNYSLIRNPNNPHENINVIQYMCGLCEGFNQFTETDWLRLVDYYDAPELIGTMTTECTASRGWDKITPESLIDWCQQRNKDYRKDTVVSIMISEWADHHGKTDESDNVKGRNLASLYLASQGILDSLIEKQMNQACNPTPAEAKKFATMTTNEWLDKILANPEYMALAKRWDYGQTTIRAEERSVKETSRLIGRSFKDRSMTFGTFWTADPFYGRIQTQSSKQKWMQVLISYPKLENRVVLKLTNLANRMWRSYARPMFKLFLSNTRAERNELLVKQPLVVSGVKLAKIWTDTLDKLTPGEWVKLLINDGDDFLLREWEKREMPKQTTVSMWCDLAKSREFYANYLVNDCTYSKMSAAQVAEIIKIHPSVCLNHQEHMAGRMVSINPDLVVDICQSRPECMGPKYRETFGPALNRLTSKQRESLSMGNVKRLSYLQNGHAMPLQSELRQQKSCSHSLRELRKDYSQISKSSIIRTGVPCKNFSVSD